MNRSHPNRLRGFSLLELSVALGIISLLVVAGVSMGAGALKAADRVSTQERLATIKQAIETYAKLNGFLPCPANRAETPSGYPGTFGFESRASQFVCNTPGAGLVAIGAVTAYIGGVPVRSLGLPDNYAGDAWGNKFTYAVSQPHIGSSVQYAASEGTLVVRYGDRAGTNYSLTTSQAPISTLVLSAYSAPTFTTSTVHGFAVGSMVRMNNVNNLSGFYLVATVPTTTTFTLQNPTTATVTLAASPTVDRISPTAGAGATYVVVSHGADGIGAFPMLGTAVPTVDACPAVGDTTNGNQTENCDNSNVTFYDTEFNNSTSQTSLLFDDYVVWGSNSAQRSLLKPPTYDNTCPPGTCSEWCARCTTNFPSSVGTNTPDPAVPPAMTNAVLCKKIMTNTTTTTCEAACIWSGTSTRSAGGGYVECP